MSVQDLKKFGQLCVENETVRARAKAIGLNDMPGQIAYAKELGFDFSLADLQTLAKTAVTSKNELSEADLEQVAGGVVTTTVAGVVAGVLIGAGVGAAAAGGVAAAASRVW